MRQSESGLVETASPWYASAMFHMQIQLQDEEDIELIVRKLNFELAPLQVHIIRHYSSSRVASRTWYVIFRGVTPENWDRMRALIDREMRNHACTYAVKRPTMRPMTR